MLRDVSGTADARRRVGPMRRGLTFLRNTPCLMLLVVQLAGVVYIAMVVTRLVSLRGRRNS